ncbi:MAG: protein-L-isoaspartate O-methyltransferase [Gammaproteobacteria bacterium]|nr:protein-L-isoaspartate O-methyltransferase [Gammaproteobacteria bacterium]
MTTESLEHARFNMVQQQIRPWEVIDRRVLETLGNLPREAFVPEAYRGLAYADIEIPLAEGQQMMFPRVEGRLLQALDIKPTERVLEVGTGSGFLTACIAHLGGEVVSIDIRQAFIDQARAALQAQGIEGVELRCQDAMNGEITGAPFDVIAVTGSLPEPPLEWKKMLRVGGRMFLVCDEAPAMEATLITRTGEASWHTEGLFETDIPPLENAPKRDHFTF